MSDVVRAERAGEALAVVGATLLNENIVLKAERNEALACVKELEASLKRWHSAWALHDQAAMERCYKRDEQYRLRKLEAPADGK